MPTSGDPTRSLPLAANPRGISLEAVLDAVGEPVYVKDSQHRFVLANEAFAAFLGCPRQQILGRTVTDFFSAETAATFQAQDDRVLSSGREDTIEASVLDSAGHARAVSVIKTLYVSQTGERYLVGSLREVTERLRTEATLRDAARFRSGLISLINHEYANALTNMKLASALLRSEEAQPLEDSRVHCYEVLEHAIEHLRSSTANFLNLNRLQSGRLELRLLPTALQPLVQDTMLLLQPMSDAKRLRLRLETELPDQQPLAVRADPECLALVVSNLLTNAVKFTPHGGKVTVRLSREAGDPAQVRCCVEDTGIGLSAPDRERILSGMPRAEESREAAAGFGIGLLLVAELLARHGSRLDLESEPGRGSRFWFCLPLWSGC